ncbi:MAG TPA: DUF2508 family protein [Pseudobacteroides sp.]|uniref:DUF2508 family protein n=1 Tax=Pseudobacteroides sp. TaxID=1968840 RepID=UPI002F94975F
MSTGTLKNNVLDQGKSSIISKLTKLFMLKEKTSFQNTRNDEYNELIESIKNARRDWICASSNFNYANDKETVDYYTYMMKACQIRYEYLIKKAKENEIKGFKIEMADVLVYDNDNIN